MTSLLIEKHQSWGFDLRYNFWWNRQKKRQGDVWLQKLSTGRTETHLFCVWNGSKVTKNNDLLKKLLLQKLQAGEVLRQKSRGYRNKQ